MAKELPYFQFEPAEYLTGDISFCSLSAQGLFTNICSYYWQRSCKLTKDQLLRRLNYPKELQELIEENVIELKGNNIVIKFLETQYLKATKQSKTNSLNGSKGGRPKKNKPIETENKPKINPIKNETKGIREDKIIQEETTVCIENEKLNTHFFISQFNRARYHPEFKLNLPKNQKTGENIEIKLTTVDEQAINFLSNKGYTNQDGKDAIVGMMMSDINLGIKKTPTHMLREDNFIKYLDSYRTGQKIQYGFNKSKDKV